MLEREMFFILGPHSQLKLVIRKEEIFPLVNTFYVAEIVTRALAKLFPPLCYAIFCSTPLLLYVCALFIFLPLTFLCKSKERL